MEVDQRYFPLISPARGEINQRQGTRTRKSLAHPWNTVIRLKVLPCCNQDALGFAPRIT